VIRIVRPWFTAGISLVSLALIHTVPHIHTGRRGRPRTAWMDNVKMWTGLSVEDSVRMTEDRDKFRKYVHGMANPRIEDS